jgi:hypothetical protein
VSDETPQRERRDKSSPLLVSASFLLTLAYLIMAGTIRPIEAVAKALKAPELMIWCVLVATQASLWSYFLVPAYKRAARHLSSFNTHRWSIIGDTIALTLLFTLFLSAHRSVTSGLEVPVVWLREVKTPVLGIIGFLTLVPCLIGMRLVAIEARAEAAAGVDAALLDKLTRLRRDLKWFLGSAAMIIGAATFANGAFRNVMNKLNTAPGKQLPASEILLYGGFCSGVLALFYVSSHVVLSRSSWALIRAAEPIRDTSAGAWVDAQAKRAKLAEAIGLGTTSMRAFQDGVAILAPLFSSSVALLLGRA